MVFASEATNLTPADSDPARDVFRKDLVTGEVALVSVSSAGEKANAAVGGDPDVSFDGSRVAFTSGQATNLFPGDLNNASDVVVRDVAAGTTVLAAQTTAGVQANDVTERPAISADGRVVAFEAVAATDNLLPGDSAGGANDIVVRDLEAGTTAGASDPTAPAGSSFPDISGDGRYVVFDTAQAYDPVNDANGVLDVYRRDMLTGAIVLASARDGLDAAGNGDSFRGVASADGGRVAVVSMATNLTGADGNAASRDVYVRDIAARTTERASVRADGVTQGTNDSERAAIAGGGGLVTFIFDDAGAATVLVPGDANARPDAHAKELVPADVAPPQLSLASPPEGAVTEAAAVTVAGAAADPSGVGALSVNGTPVRPGADGSFAVDVPLALGPNAIEVAATDGAGNAARAARTVTRTAPAAGPQPAATTPARRPRALAVRPVVRGRQVRVSFRLTANARVQVTLLRRVVRRARAPRRTTLVRVGRPVTRTLTAGRRTVVLRPPRLTRGRYVVRVRARSAAGATVTSAPLRVVRPAARR